MWDESEGAREHIIAFEQETLILERLVDEESKQQSSKKKLTLQLSAL